MYNTLKTTLTDEQNRNYFIDWTGKGKVIVYVCSCGSQEYKIVTTGFAPHKKITPICCNCGKIFVDNVLSKFDEIYDECPCGSGIKYGDCCWNNQDDYEKRKGAMLATIG